MPSVAVVGNCQAPMIESIIAMHSDWSVVRLPPVFLMPPEQEEVYLETLSGVDFIFAQRISDDYLLPFIRTSYLKQNFSNVISWPNLYFSGYFPDVEYIYLSGIGKLVGPLDDYHMRTVVTAYQGGKSVEDCLKMYGIDSFAELYPDPIGSSLEALRLREREVDVTLSGFIEDNLHRHKLFYTVNHPVNACLFETTRLLLAAAGGALGSTDGHPYALARVNIPIYRALRVKHRLATLPEGSFVGIDRLNFATPPEQASARVYQGWEEVVDVFYRFYDSVPQMKGAPGQ